MSIAFSKYHGLGNDFILIDNRDSHEPKLSQAEAQQWCDRNFGIGADGVIFALPGQAGQPGQEPTDYTMRIFNSDGSEPEMCGNGIRCMARFIADLEGISHDRTDDIEPAAPTQYRIQTLAGVIIPTIQADGLVRVDMGEPRLRAAEIPTTLAETDGNVVAQPLEVDGKTWEMTCVSMGNPHAIAFVPDVDAIDLAVLGPQFEHHPVFPARTNTEFVQVISPSQLKMRVWERGAGATLACGTGACASLVAAVLNGKSDRTATLELPGGNLIIEWSQTNHHLYMTGPAQRVFSGVWQPGLSEATGAAGVEPGAMGSAPVQQVDCAIACVNGCILGDQCPNRENQGKAAAFIRETPLDKMLEMAAAAVERRNTERAERSRTESPKWVIPEGGIDPNQF